MHNKLNKDIIEDARKVDVLRKVFMEEETKFSKKFGPSQITDRVGYIVEKLCDLYKISVEGWSWSNSGFNENDGFCELNGYFESNMILDKDFHICANFADIDGYFDGKGNFMSEIVINGQIYDPFMGIGDLVSCEICFPTRWIFEDFEEELEKSKILYELSKK